MPTLSSAPTIPAVFHFVWLGEPMRQFFKDCIQSWRDRHPSWQVIVWDEDMVPPLKNQELFDDAETIAPRGNGALQFRADILRYEILWRLGGVYVDCDFECQRPIDDLIRDAQVFAAWEETDHWINNAIMGAVPHHPMLEALVNGLPESVRELAPGMRPNAFSGPQYLTGVAGAFKHDLTILPKDMFYPYLWNELERGGEDFPHAYAIHHWNNMRTMAHAH